MINRILIMCALVLGFITSYANNLKITNVELSGDQLNFNVEWSNSWRVGLEFHDAVWIFVKQSPNGGPSWLHCNISAASVGSGFETLLPSDKVGVFIRRNSDGSGTSSTSVTFTLDNQIGMFQDIKVMGVEMVYVPQGIFFAGDGVSNARIHQGNDATKSIKITSEGALSCGTTASDIDYNTTSCWDLDVAYPKGFNAFYSMKYTITQGQYVDFLNCLPRDQQEEHVETSISGATTTLTNFYVMTDGAIPFEGNVIRCDANIGLGNITFYCDLDKDGVPNEANDGQGRAMNNMCRQDWTAYLDWSGLRPMSFLEYEKACRGPLAPIPGEFSWGSSLRNTPTTVLNVGTTSEDYVESGTTGGLSNYNMDVIRVGCNAIPSGTSRELSNTSYYGISDLGNNPGDYYLEEDYGASYKAIHGDGSLSVTGFSDVISWPTFDCNSSAIKLTWGSSSVSSLGTFATFRSIISGGRGIRSLF